MTPREIRVLRQCNKIKGDMARFEKDILTLISHPKATPEQIDEARQRYLNLKNRIADINELVWRATAGRVQL
jgi:hypothetical protein